MKTCQDRKKRQPTKTASIPLVNIHYFCISKNNYKIQQRQTIITAILGFKETWFKPKQCLTKTWIFVNEIIHPLNKC